MRNDPAWSPFRSLEAGELEHDLALDQLPSVSVILPDDGDARSESPGSAFGNGGATDMATIGQAVRVFRNTPTLAAFNPFTTTPVKGVNWDFNTTPGSAFGTALNHLAYTTPRLFRFSAGIRF